MTGPPRVVREQPTQSDEAARGDQARGDQPGLRAQARVDLAAIEANTRRLGELAGDADVMAVVKADGYGHGLLPSARAALAGGASWLGVALLEEARELREAGITEPLLAWLFTPGEDLAPVIAADIDLGIYSLDELRRTRAAAERAGTTARVHLKVDTGLSRGGATDEDWPDLVEAAGRAQAAAEIDVVGVWSHFANADGGADHPVNAAQAARFAQACEIAAPLRPQVRHLANSAATLTAPHTHYDLVRPGVSLYGLCPVGDPADFGLRPAMTLTATVALTKRVPAGSGVSYGHAYVTDRPTTLALVPMGYADGVDRGAGGTCDVLLGGRRRRISGRVCMDQFLVDVGDDDVQAGDELVLFGPGDDDGPTARQWADALATIDYEVVTRVGPRVPRTHGSKARPDGGAR